MLRIIHIGVQELVEIRLDAVPVLAQRHAYVLGLAVLKARRAVVLYHDIEPMGARPRVGELPLLLDAHLVLRVRRESIIRDREVVVQLGLFLACQIIHPFDKACRHMMMTGMAHIASLPQVPLAASVESHCAMVSVIFDPCISRSSHRDF